MADSSSNAGNSSIHDMSSSQIQVDMPNCSQQIEDSDNNKAHLESIKEEAILETEEEHLKSSFVNSKKKES